METEAYVGPTTPFARAQRPRGEPGDVQAAASYVCLVYGMHCFNGNGTEGIRRGAHPAVEPLGRTCQSGLVCRAGIDRSLNGLDLTARAILEDRPRCGQDQVGPRIGGLRGEWAATVAPGSRLSARFTRRKQERPSIQC